MLKPPKSMCNQSIRIKLKVEDPEDIYGDSENYDEIMLNNCVVHARTVYEGSNNNRQIVSNATIMLYAGITTPFIDLTKDNLGSKIVYNGLEYTLTNISEDRDPFSNEIYQYKLGVI
ncbi:putative minor capsid protein [Ligilactobacillus ruminis]|uniref:putative minor capsid protein n=1 Tax=Ligilactobacillus ruminis TaxID=1623 RepID=UPI002060FAED|nr:putative minor capsid protein [Ligilactobacillus ruminis]DAH12741.1 MAG TPA: Minor capsid protein [Caudoviricetes sp.]